MKISVLLSTYNGHRYLAEQLDSLYRQTLPFTKLLIRDDGSKDDTLAIIERYKERYGNIEYYQGENLGPAKSFFELIRKADESDYYALCDQDDVWFDDKIERAVKTLEDRNSDEPLLYASRYTLTDEKLEPIASDVSKLYSFSDFPHSLIYHSAPGCTFVFNEQARKKILQYDLEKEYYMIHDAIIHKVVALFGTFVLDETSHIYYRQHGDNEIGMSADKAKTFLGRINRFLNGKMKNYRSLTARSLLNVYGEECDEDKRHLLEVVANYQSDSKLKKELLNNECFRTGTINDLFFRILVLLNYI